MIFSKVYQNFDPFINIKLITTLVVFLALPTIFSEKNNFSSWTEDIVDSKPISLKATENFFRFHKLTPHWNELELQNRPCRLQQIKTQKYLKSFPNVFVTSAVIFGVGKQADLRQESAPKIQLPSTPAALLSVSVPRNLSKMVLYKFSGNLLDPTGLVWSFSRYWRLIQCSRQYEDETFADFFYWLSESSNGGDGLCWSDDSCGLPNCGKWFSKNSIGGECIIEEDSYIPIHQKARFDKDREVFPNGVWVHQSAHPIWILNGHWFSVSV